MGAKRDGTDVGGSTGMVVTLGLGENSTVDVEVAVSVIVLFMHDMGTPDRSDGWRCQRIEAE